MSSTDSTRPLGKTAALKAAQSACGPIHRRSGTDFVCWVPFHRDRISGPTTEIQSYSRQRLVAMRARIVAETALQLMGEYVPGDYESIDVDVERAIHYGCRGARGIVEHVIRERLRAEP